MSLFKFKVIRCTALFISFTLYGVTAFADTAYIACASNFTEPMKTLVHIFETQTGHNLKVSYGSSGKFAAQIAHGAPFDVFLSADQAKPHSLTEQGLTVQGTQFTYALGTLVLWSADSALINSEALVLTGNAYRKIALANPKLAPYGEAAVEVLTNLHLLDETKPKWVQGENIAQTYQFIATGNAELGFVAFSQLQADNTPGSYWIVPKHLYTPIKQDAVLLSKGGKNVAARQWLEYLKSPSAQEIIHGFGYASAP